MKRQKIGIVTGASSGLGRHIAYQLCAKGHVVYAVARRRDLLLSLQEDCADFPGEIEVMSGNLLDESFRASIVPRVVKEKKRLDFLINNAGYGSLILLEKQESADIKQTFEINCVAYGHVTQLTIPIMRKQGGGRIISTCSIAGLNAPALLSTYGATKYAVLGYMKPLRYELEGSGISLGLVFPPRMQTDFWVTALKCYDLTEEERKDIARKLTKGTADPKKIARKVVAELETNRFMILPGYLPWMTHNVLRHVYWLYDFFMNRFMLRQAQPLLQWLKVKENYTADLRGHR